MRTHILRDTLQTLLGIGIGFVGISVVNSRAGGQSSPLQLFGYAIALTGLLVAGRAVFRSLVGRHPTLRDLRTPALFVATGFAGDVVITLLPSAYQAVVGNVFFTALFVVGCLAFLRTRRWLAVPRADDSMDGTHPGDAPQRRPPP